MAGQVRANWLSGADTSFVANYMSSRQDDANRWDQILGGDGNLIAELNDLQLDLGLRAPRELECRLVRSRVGHLFVQHAT